MTHMSSIRTLTVPRQVRAALRDQPMLAWLADLSDQILLDAVAQVSFGKGQSLFLRNDPARYVYVVLDGQIGLTSDNAVEDSSQLIELVSPGACLGEEALIDGCHGYSARSYARSRCLAIDLQAVPESVLDVPRLSAMVVKQLLARQSRLFEEIATLKALPPLQRLARLLLPEIGETANSQYRLPWSKSVMADRIGVRRETFSRLIKTLASHGAIIDGNTVTLTDTEALSALAKGEIPGQGPRKAGRRGTGLR